MPAPGVIERVQPDNGNEYERCLATAINIACGGSGITSSNGSLLNRAIHELGEGSLLHMRGNFRADVLAISLPCLENVDFKRVGEFSVFDDGRNEQARKLATALRNAAAKLVDA